MREGGEKESGVERASESYAPPSPHPILLPLTACELYAPGPGVVLRGAVGDRWALLHPQPAALGELPISEEGWERLYAPGPGRSLPTPARMMNMEAAKNGR